MRRPHRTRQLRSILARELEEQFRRCGWVPDAAAEAAPASLCIAAFRRSLGGEFTATAAVNRLFARPAGKKVEVAIPGIDLIVALMVGVAHIPTRALAAAIGAPPSLGAAAVDVLTAVSDTRLVALPLTRSHAVAVRTPVQARRVAAELAELATECAPAVSARFASIDALLAQARQARQTGGPGAAPPATLAVAALLAAAGRHEEARAELTTAAAPDGQRPSLRAEHRRLRWRLGRWIDARAAGSPPTGPPDARAVPEPSPRFRELWRETRRLRRAQRRALAAVRAGARGKGRDQLRSELVTQLAARTDRREPLWVERRADELAASRRERRRARARRRREGRALLGVLGGGLRGRGWPEPPAWLDPPDHAVFAIPRRPRADKSLVALEPDATAGLARIYAALLATDAEAGVPVWLAWNPEPRTEFSTIEVHIGPHRVGALDRAATAVMAPVMDSAAERGELLCVDGTLHRRDGDRGFLLEIPLPTGPPARR